MPVRSTTTWSRLNFPEEIQNILDEAPRVIMPASRAHLAELALGGQGQDTHEVIYNVPGKGNIHEATVVQARNGVVVNYTEPYMRRRDPDSMVIADDLPTDKKRFEDRFDFAFDDLRTEVLDWLRKQELVVTPFYAGSPEYGYHAVLIGPANAAFFATALADLQGLIPADEIPENFKPRAVIYLAPPFRHTHMGGKQVVIHNRNPNLYELFSLNLYPGPSAKKGIYGLLLTIGEEEGWITAHGSTVQVVTPYDNVVTIMHEGASGGGKSEMLEYVLREPDGRLLLGRNVVTGERRYLPLGQGCALHPVTDDMALCHPTLQDGNRKLVVTDAEDAWFVRVNHIDHYGTDPHMEALSVHPPQPLVFLSIQGKPGATTLIWEHTEDAPGRPCPNPRIILPRSVVPNIVNEPVEVDIRSFGIRTPPCSSENPTYGILGLMHILPPALAWLWRLVAPRGHANPSITDSEGMSSEGVGSYWPFATGRRVDQANLQLNLIRDTPGTRYIITPNQHVGAWKTGFMPQWLAREYLARRGGARFRPEQITPARCPLLGYALDTMQIEGVQISRWFLQVETQPQVGEQAYDEGAQILGDFFQRELGKFHREADLDPLGRDIIDCCLGGGTVQDYEALIPV